MRYSRSGSRWELQASALETQQAAELGRLTFATAQVSDADGARRCDAGTSEREDSVGLAPPLDAEWS